MENSKKISEKVLKIKEIIETKEYKIKELQNFYNNINNSKEKFGSLKNSSSNFACPSGL